MIRSSAKFLTAGAVLAWVSTALAGPDWCTTDFITDAGSTPATAQRVTTAGPVQKICGMLSTGLVADFEDMYLIQITNSPAPFSARTDMLPGMADFDTELWLFSGCGLGLLGNDDSPTNNRSRIFPPSDDGLTTIIPPGCYFLAISGHPNVPQSPGGNIFNQATLTEISGPDGAGGGSAITGWTGNGAVGTYTISLTGVAGAPEGTCTVTCPGIPTVGEWGLIALTLLLLTAATLMLRRHAVLFGVANGGAVPLPHRQPLFVPGVFAQSFLLAVAMAGAGFGTAFVLAKPLGAADVGGALVCIPMLAYLLHLWRPHRRR